MAADPYSEVYEALWALLESSADFVAMVPEGNRIKFTATGADRDPIKREITTSDLPEVRLIPSTSAPHPYRCSDSHSDMVTWELQFATGDFRADLYLFPLKWIVFRVMADVEKYLRDNVLWSGEQIVKIARPVSVRSGLSETDLQRGIRGWACIWAIETELWFPLSIVTP